MAQRATQAALKGFEQGRVPDVETWMDRVMSARDGIVAMKEQLKNAEFKLLETMELREAELDHQESEDGDKLIVYDYGTYHAKVKRGKKTVDVRVDKVSRASADDIDLGDDADEEGGED